MNAAHILASIHDLNVLVIGDVCLDRWCYYDPDLSEPSRETGIPRLAVVNTELTPGAAGTIANNLVSLGVRKVGVVGAVGQDGFGWELMRALTARHIAPDLLVRSAQVTTFTYTKLINSRTGEEDRPRVDFISSAAIPADVEEELSAHLRQWFHHFDVILVSDQAETDTAGVVTPAVRETLIDLATASPEKIVWVDSRVRIEHFRDVIAKPNAMEAEQACLRAFNDVDLRRLYESRSYKLMMVTDGSNGVRVFDAAQERHVPGRNVKAVDICGAGDAFSAGASCALAATGDPIQAAEFGNLIASITVQKRGTGSASPQEVLQAAGEA
ncbi:MAG TPA: PfkB family carbohydrate kinase [Bryobacteraceae bacterium]|nr:PfkB family carbohydrate kinase [Bryobacteraceae bacterium]